MAPDSRRLCNWGSLLVSVQLAEHKGVFVHDWSLWLLLLAARMAWHVILFTVKAIPQFREKRLRAFAHERVRINKDCLSAKALAQDGQCR